MGVAGLPSYGRKLEMVSNSTCTRVSISQHTNTVSQRPDMRKIWDDVEQHLHQSERKPEHTHTQTQTVNGQIWGRNKMVSNSTCTRGHVVEAVGKGLKLREKWVNVKRHLHRRKLQPAHTQLVNGQRWGRYEMVSNNTQHKMSISSNVIMGWRAFVVAELSYWYRAAPWNASMNQNVGGNDSWTQSHGQIVQHK